MLLNGVTAEYDFPQTFNNTELLLVCDSLLSGCDRCLPTHTCAHKKLRQTLCISQFELCFKTHLSTHTRTYTYN